MLNTLINQLVEFAFCLWLIYLFGNLFFDRQRKRGEQPVAEIVDPVREATERKRVCRALGMPEPQGVA